MRINVTLDSFGLLSPEAIGAFEAKNPGKVLEYVIRSLSRDYAGDIKVEKLQKEIYLPDMKTATGDINPLRTEHTINIGFLQERRLDTEKYTGEINKILSNCARYKPVSSE